MRYSSGNYFSSRLVPPVVSLLFSLGPLGSTVFSISMPLGFLGRCCKLELDPQTPFPFSGRGLGAQAIGQGSRGIRSVHLGTHQSLNPAIACSGPETLGRWLVLCAPLASHLEHRQHHAYLPQPLRGGFSCII